MNVCVDIFFYKKFCVKIFFFLYFFFFFFFFFFLFILFLWKAFVLFWLMEIQYNGNFVFNGNWKRVIFNEKKNFFLKLESLNWETLCNFWICINIINVEWTSKIRHDQVIGIHDEVNILLLIISASIFYRMLQMGKCSLEKKKNLKV